MSMFTDYANSYPYVAGEKIDLPWGILLKEHKDSKYGYG